jgi:excisionase family DNA binding protein
MYLSPVWVEPTTADLVSYWGGRNRLLRVTEVAEMLAVGDWALYQYCENGELPRFRLNNSIRIRPSDLQEFIAARVTIPEKPRRHRPKLSE